MPNELDQDPILSAMRAKMRHLEASMTSYLAFLGNGDLPIGDLSQVLDGSSSTDIPDGVFHGKTIPAAVKLLLSIVKKKQTTAEIEAGLKKGGMESTAKHFNKTVRTTLERMWTSRQEIIKTGGTWALPEFFSPQVRASFTSEPAQNKNQPRSKKRAKRAPKKAPAPAKAKQAKKTQAPTPQQPSPAPGGTAGGGTMSQIEALLREHPAKEYTAEQVAAVFQIERVQTAGLLLGRLVTKKKAERTANGKYRAPRADPQTMPVAS